MKHSLFALSCWLLAPAAFAILDTNQNGLSDIWEKEHNAGELFPETFDPQADYDKDGWSNEMEAAAGTDPFDPNPTDGLITPDILHVPAVMGEENGVPYIETPEAVTVTWPTIPGKLYHLLVSTDLSHGSWIEVPNSAFISNGNIPEFHFTTAESDKLFWRVAVTDTDTDSDSLTDAEERQIGSSPYLSDTDGDGTDDATAVATGLDPSGSGGDSDGDGIPDNELYSVVFEVQTEHHSMPPSVGYESYDSSDSTHRYLTMKESETYSVSNSPSYTSVTNGQYIRTTTYLVNGQIPDNCQSATSEVGVTFSEWKGTHSQSLGEDEMVHWEATVRTVDGPTITGTQSKTITTDTTPWTVTVDNTVVRSGIEIITVTLQTDLSDQTTYPQFWTNHVKSRPWQELQPHEYGPNESIDFLRAIFGDSVAAQSIRNNYLQNGFGILGTITAPGRTFADYGSNTRIKSLRWRWVRFNPQNPFYYEYIAPPASLIRTFHLLVSQHDYLGPYLTSGGSDFDETATKGIVEIVCNANEGTSEWQTVSLTKFDPFKLEDPTVLANMDFSKVGWSHVRFDNLPAQIIPDKNPVVSADDHSITIVFQMGNVSVGSQQDSTIEWQIESGSGGSLSETETQLKDGLSAVTLTTSTVKGAKYVLKARIKAIGPDGEDISGASPWIKSPEIEVIAGQPYSILLEKSKGEYRSDGTDTIDLEAEVKDAHDNLVEDGSAVTWLINHSITSPFSSVEFETTNGIANAILVAPLVPENQIVDVTSGQAAAQATIEVGRVTGSLSGDVNLQVGHGSNASSTIIATVQASDGTPVFWTTSNGEIVSNTVVTNGSSSTTLSCNNGRLGQVVVTASIGDKLLYLEGAFTSNGVLAIGAEHPVLVSDETANGTETVTYDHGIAREITHYASTPVRISGPPNQTVEIDVQSSAPVAEWLFATHENQIVPSNKGNHPLTLVDASIVEQPSIIGGGSLHFEGNGHATVSAHQDLDFTDQFSVSMLVMPQQHAACTLVEKPGVWKIQMLGDGKIQAWVQTSVANYTATTTQTIPLNAWADVQVDFLHGMLKIHVNGIESAHASSPGTLPANTQALLIGNQFIGYIDSLTLLGGINTATHMGIAGLGPNGTIQLDANGSGQFTISSLGTAPAGTYVTFKASYNPMFLSGVRLYPKEVWHAVNDVALSFLGGDPETMAGTAAGVAGGLLVVGDVGACGKNLWRMTGWTDKKPNYTELSLSGIGILTTFVSTTGVGTAADGGLSALRVLANRLGNSPQAARFIEVFTEMIKKASVGVGEFGLAELKFLQKMVADSTVADAFKVFLHDEFLAKAAVKAADKLGDNAESFYQAAKRALDSHGEEAAKSFVQVFENMGADAFTALRNAPASELDEALDGLAKLVSKGIPQFTLKRILQNEHLYGTAYKQTNLLKDLGELADIPNLEGLGDAVAMLKAYNAQAKGFRYEIEGAAWLARNEKEVVKLTKRIDGTDIDVVIREGNDLIYYQLKRSKEALGYGERGLQATKAWVKKAMKDLETNDYSRVKYALPENVDLPPQIENWFSDVLDDAIEIVRIPHLD